MYKPIFRSPLDKTDHPLQPGIETKKQRGQLPGHSPSQTEEPYAPRPGYCEPVFMAKFTVDDEKNRYSIDWSDALDTTISTSTPASIVLIPKNILALLPKTDRLESYWPVVQRAIQREVKKRKIKKWVKNKAQKTKQKLKELFSISALKSRAQIWKVKLFSKFKKTSALPDLKQEIIYPSATGKDVYNSFEKLQETIQEYTKYGLCVFRPSYVSTHARITGIKNPTDKEKEKISTFLMVWAKRDLSLYLPYSDRLPFDDFLKNFKELSRYLMQLPGALILRLSEVPYPVVNSKQITAMLNYFFLEYDKVLRNFLEEFKTRSGFVETSDHAAQLAEVRKVIENNFVNAHSKIPYSEFTHMELLQFPITRVEAALSKKRNNHLPTSFNTVIWRIDDELKAHQQEVVETLCPEVQTDEAKAETKLPRENLGSVDLPLFDK